MASTPSSIDKKNLDRMSSLDPESTDQAPLGKPWMYKPCKVGRWTFPWFASPEVQLVLVSFVCFLCPGMFNAVSGLGGGGQVDAGDVSDANTALYSTFAVVGFFAGSIANWIGLRLTLSIGGFGYFLYVAALLSYNHNQNVGFLIFAGALLGVCGGLLWCAQGAVMMSYPNEKEKGKFISTFWVIFNLGGVIGSLVRNLPFPIHALKLTRFDLGSPRPKPALVLWPGQRWYLYRLHGPHGDRLHSRLGPGRLEICRAP